MPMIVLVGNDAALLEGLTQMLAGAGFRTRLAPSVGEARELARTELPLVAVVDRALAGEPPGASAIRLVAGGALVLYHRTADHGTSLAPSVQRAALSDLALPLERHRLLTL